MPNTNLADLTIVLDRSGSMSSCRDATIAGFNDFLAGQKAVPGQATLSLSQFDHAYEAVYTAIPLAETVDLTPETFVPRGNTRLLDAIGHTIRRTRRRHDTLPEAHRPGRVLIAVITDGYENASQRYGPEKVATMIAEAKAKHDWQFVFIGTEEAAITDAQGWGVDAGSSIRFCAASKRSTRGSWRALSNSSSRYRTDAPGTEHQFTDQERAESEGSDRDDT